MVRNKGFKIIICDITKERNFENSIAGRFVLIKPRGKRIE